MDQHLHAGGEAGSHHQGLFHGKEGLGQGGSAGHRPADGNRQQLSGSHCHIFRVAAAMGERRHFIAQRPAAYALAESDDLAADLEPGQRRGIGRRVVGAAALPEVGRVEAGCRDADQHLAGARLRGGQAHRLQHFWAAELGDGDGGHFGRDRHGSS